MNDIVNELEKKKCESITNEKKWIRNCPKCGREIIYLRKASLDRSIKNKCLCKSCPHIGKLKSEEHKRKISQSHIGIKHTEETKQKLSLNHRGLFSGEKNFWYGKNRSGKNNPMYGKTGKDCVWYGKHHSYETKMIMSKKRLGNVVSGVSRYKMRMAAIDRIKQKRIKPYTNYNPKACEYFDTLNKERNWKLQHALNGGEIEVYGYFLDAYDKDKNVIVEYDEPKHYDKNGNLRKKDYRRQKEIIDIAKPSQFWRYNSSKKELTCVYSGA